MGRALWCTQVLNYRVVAVVAWRHICYDGLMSLGIKRHQTWRHKLYVLPSIAVSTLLPDNESTLDAQILLSNSVLQDCGLYRLPVSVSRVYSDHILMIYFKAWTRGLFAHSPVSGQNVWQRIKDIETHLKLIFVCAPVGVMKLSAFAAMPNMTSVRASSNSTMRPFRRPMTFGYLLI